MTRIQVVIIGAGQAGLAMSRCLSARDIDHVVLERGRIGERWRSERWDSLRLLTPNWMTRLPGYRYRGADPDGFMTMPEVIGFLQRYAEWSAAPVVEGTDVLSVSRRSSGYRVETTRGEWQAQAVVIATGQCDRPAVPDIARALPAGIRQITPSAYRRPQDLPPGGVLVVGAAASGVQLAEEIHRSGRPVTLAVGRHVRVPRRYRGRDIMWWLDRAGILTQTADTVTNLPRARSQSSFQLAGRSDGRSSDLAVLQGLGVRLTGHLAGLEDGTAHFRADLPETVAKAQSKLERLLDGLDAVVPGNAPRDPAARRRIAVGTGPSRLNLADEGIASVVWAVGFRRIYDWLKVPVVDTAGEIMHDGGVTPAAGLYVLGLGLMRRRNSTFIDGVGADAEDLARHLHAFLTTQRPTFIVAGKEERPWLVQTAMTC